MHLNTRDKDFRKKVTKPDINSELKLVTAVFWQEVLIALCNARKKAMVGLASEMTKWLLFCLFLVIATSTV